MSTSKAPISLSRLALCRSLWGWPDCPICDSQQKSSSNCTAANCPGNRLTSLEPFFRYYEETAASYVPDLRPRVPAALDSHASLLRLISHIKQNPAIRKDELARIFFATQGAYDDSPSGVDQSRALVMALKVMAMVDGSAITSPITEHSIGWPLQTLWGRDCSYAELWGDYFPERECPELEDRSSTSTIRASLCARKLTKVGRLKLIGTNDLRNHLRLDCKLGTVDIYHHTSVLKEHLYETRDHPESHGNVPRALALETLDTIYDIIFPFGDPGSQSILRRLVSREGLDPECQRSASTAYRRPSERNQVFRYWGTRILDLYDEVENPTPRGILETWLQRRSGARHVMMATLVGVMIAIILGFSGLAVTIFSAWVAYQQWQHPVTT